MSNFDFEVKIDTTNVNRRVDEVVRGLTNVEAQALATSRSLGGAFANPLRDAQGRFVATGVAAKQAADGIGAAADAQKRMNDAADHAAHGGMDIGHLAGAFGIAFSAHEIIEVANSYVEVSNKIRVATENTGEFNEVMAETQAVALRTRTSWSETASTFQRLRAVTQEMGLTQKDVIKLTQEMAMGAKVSGANSQEAAMAMAEFTHAFEIGALTGREFKVLMRDVPAELKLMREAAGLTGQQFAEMGKHGKITGTMLYEMFQKAAPEIERQFGKTTATATETWEQFKTKISETIGTINSSFGVFTKLGQILNQVSENVGTLGKTFGLLKDAVNALPGASGGGGSEESTFDKVTDKVKTVTSYILNPLKFVKLGIDEIADHIGEKLTNGIGRAVAGMHDLETAVKDSADHLEHIAELDNKMKRLGISMKDMSIGALDQAQAYDAQRIKLEQVGTTAGVTGTIMEDKFGAARAATKKLDAELEKLKEQDALRDLSEKAAILHRELDGVNLVLRAQNKHMDDLAEKQRNLKSLIASGEAFNKMQASTDMKDIGLFTRDDQETAARNAARLTENRKALAEVTNEINLRERGFTDTTINAHKATLDEKFATEELDRALQEGVLTWEEYEKATKKAHGALSEMEKILQRLVKPFHDFALGESALNNLFSGGRITAKEFETEMRKLLETAEHAGAVINTFTMGKNAQGQALSFSTDRLRGAPKPLKSMTEELGITPSSQLTEQYTEVLHKQATIMQQILDPAREYADQQARLGELLAQNAITQGEYNVLSQKTEETYRANTRALSPLNAETTRFRKELQELSEKRDITHGLKDGLNAIYDEVMDISTVTKTTLGDAFKGLEDNLVSVFSGGETSWKEFANTVERDLIRLAMRLLEMRLLASFLPGGTEGGFAGSLADAFGSVFGGSHATGGSYTAGGSGGPDSQLVMFRMSPGERADFTPRGAPQTGGAVVENHIHLDPRALLDSVSTAAGRRAIHSVIRRNPGAFRSLLGGS